ncbi:short-chain dehydrogenase [Salinisphaera orenii MK-B5]|uniref:Short-chain dehydrogenase n=1 Tax=Salinisphaera orenii MK-B5 TaxID=856730 RepID=A0A423PTE4_9GAMM|nr:SDR family oxidoreductase [Salinisphaera orenii]ROO28886.1 short-chain dehydrogenase [Salinisphaera orenii MK-B5]
MSDKIAFITGANRGIGRSMAHHLAAAGVGVIGTYRSHRDEADAVVREIAEAGGRAAMLELDVGDSTAFAGFTERLAATLADTFDRADLDFVVHNAGDGILAPYEDTSADDLDALYRVHFKGPFLLSQQLLPLIARGGRILNVSTAATRFVLDNHCAYSAMKSALEVTTRYMAKELGDRGITVNAIAPGAVETDFAGGAVRDDPELNAHFRAITPLGRTAGPDDIGAAVAGLLSSDFAWLNGERIELTGGQSL